MDHDVAALGAMRRSISRPASRWPFRVKPAEAPSPTTPHHGGGIPRRQEVEFRDGERVWLYSVETHGTPDRFVRRLGAPAEGTLLDLRRFIPDMERELPTTNARDVAGYVAFSLRLRFATREAFIEAAVKGGMPS